MATTTYYSARMTKEKENKNPPNQIHFYSIKITKISTSSWKPVIITKEKMRNGLVKKVKKSIYEHFWNYTKIRTPSFMKRNNNTKFCNTKITRIN